MTFGLCKYKNVFGIPGQGIHSYRFGKGIIGPNGIAVVDISVVAFVALIFSYWLNRSFLLTFLLFIILGIIVHRIFCVDTAIDVLLFPNVKDH
jgi:hypothetical protein